jgi:short-subunit dehydrogenase
MHSLRDKRVLITGAGHGLGRALAVAFAAAGAEIIVTDRDPESVADTVRSLLDSGHRATGYPLDVTDVHQIAAVRDRLHAEQGPLDVLINNAGVVFGGSFLDVPASRHRATLDVNLLGPILVTHGFLPDLLTRPEAAVVNIASAAALVALPHAVSYAASKTAVLAFSDSLREELRLLGRRHVRVTTVCPSYIDTGLFAGARPARLTWMLTAEQVARSVRRAVERRRELVLEPWTVRILDGSRGLLPRAAFRRLCAWFGVYASMTAWRGRADP